MALAQSLGMPAYIYENHYSKNDPEKIRYRVEFEPLKELVDKIVCQKKVNHYIPSSPVLPTAQVKVREVSTIDYSGFSYDVETESDHFEVSGIYSHNCRSGLSPWKDENGNYKFYGRFNKGVVTINLVDVALSSQKDTAKFWKIFDERLELCYKALLCRYERLKGTPSDVAPILWQHGAIARLEKGEPIDKYLTGGYSTISLGYAGLWECVYYMTGSKLTEEVGRNFGLEVMQHMNKKCDEWNERCNLGFGIYGTPLESTVYKFAKCLQNRFGTIQGVTDKNYITNSYHTHVTESIDAFSKLHAESAFQSLSTGGAISYVEVPNLTNNIDAVLMIMKYIYENIMYAELNTKSDYCQVCGFDGEIQIVEDDNKKLIWKCPNCGNTDENKLNVARRTCGYIGSNFWNQGRTQEIKERVVHLGDNE
ncbi:MAG TPA: ribonucleoside-triphosphate reductase [Lachnospiraceae bacterium]|nr:ribonucleoside-triphosphate reductase [Lachnospiraceae bacterium]